MLTAGEYVVSPEAAASIGTETLDSINGMRYANGGSVGSVPSSSKSGSGKGGDNNISITVNVENGGSASEKQEGSGGDSGAKEFTRKVKEAVLNVINEERESGSLFTRNK